MSVENTERQVGERNKDRLLAADSQIFRCVNIWADSKHKIHYCFSNKISWNFIAF